MSLDIIVRRDLCGPYKHDDVTQPLLGNSTEAGVTLGESILDAEGTGLQAVEYVIGYKPSLRCGLSIKVYDTLYGGLVYGKIVSIEHVCRREDGTSLTLKTRLTIVMPTKFFSISQ